jgi:ABC-2 type transport system ATP-binding protein
MIVTVVEETLSWERSMSTALLEMPHKASLPQPSSIARTRSLKKSYGTIVALHDVNLEIRAGELLALLGPNGAGKTTLVHVLLGMAWPDAGSVSVFGADPYTGAIQTRVGAMLQVGRVPETLKVREHIDLFSSYYPAPLPIEETLAIAGLTEIKNRPYGELSGGQKQRVLFAIAICGDPDLLFLDEPTVGLDVESRRLMWTQIRSLIARGKTILLTTHYLNEADALADRILVLNRGAIIAEGTPAEIKARAMGKQIRCTSRLSLDEVRGIAGVLSAKADRNVLELHVNAAEPVVRELLQRDAWLADLEVANAGLEEAFLALTQNHNAEVKEN